MLEGACAPPPNDTARFQSVGTVVEILTFACSMLLGVPGLMFLTGNAPEKEEDKQLYLEFWEYFIVMPHQLRGEVSVRFLGIHQVNFFFFFVGVCQAAGSVRTPRHTGTETTAIRG
jgi:hypothetical protein